jgi:hypothetical protein
MDIAFSTANWLLFRNTHPNKNNNIGKNAEDINLVEDEDEDAVF